MMCVWDKLRCGTEIMLLETGKIAIYLLIEEGITRGRSALEVPPENTFEHYSSSSACSLNAWKLLSFMPENRIQWVRTHAMRDVFLYRSAFVESEGEAY